MDYRSDSYYDYEMPRVQSGVLKRDGRGPPLRHNQMSSMEQQISKFEEDAYLAVLRAFGAQSENISWKREGLISDLRKELRVTDEQHRKILGRVASDETLSQIRDLKRGSSARNNFHPPQPALQSTTSERVSKKGVLVGPYAKKEHAYKGADKVSNAPNTVIRHSTKKPPDDFSVKERISKGRKVDMSLESIPSELEALAKEVESLEQKIDLRKLKDVKLFAKEIDSLLVKALAEMVDSSDDDEKKNFRSNAEREVNYPDGHLGDRAPSDGHESD